MPIKPGDRLGQYEIVEEIGRGGMAAVFKGYQPAMGRHVAIKILPEQFLHDPNFLDRFTREARVIAQLEHQNILPVYDFGEVNGVPFIVMRLMTHGSLGGRLRAGPLPLPQAVILIGQIASALDLAHSKGVIHRDLKPDNILLDDSGNAYLSDFGIAKVVETATKTTGSMIVGTPNYMSPEQARGEKIGRPTDIYALGALTFEILTGRPPFQAENFMGLLFKHANDPVPSLRGFNPALPEGLQPVIEKAMAKDPAARYATARAMAADLERVARGRAAEATVYELPPSEQVTTYETPVVIRQGGSAPPTAIPPTAPPQPVARRSASLWVGLGVGGCLLALIAVIAVAAVAGGLPALFQQVVVVVTATPASTRPPATSPPSQDAGGSSPTVTPTQSPLQTAAPTSAPTSPPAPTRTPAPSVLYPYSVSASNYDTTGSQDAQGNPTTFEPANAIDGIETTAWRVPGDGRGEWLMVEFAQPVLVARIGLIPGYAKTDPYDGTDRFAQNYAVESARIEFSDGTQVTQYFDYSRDMQYLEVGSAQTSFVRIVILSAYAPRSSNPRDFTAVSEVQVLGWLP